MTNPKTQPIQSEVLDNLNESSFYANMDIRNLRLMFAIAATVTPAITPGTL